MKLRRIEVRNFRKLDSVVIDDLAPGLNVIVGDNEAGKSTLLAALRAALFERHRVTGQTLAAMLPYNKSVRPEVEIDFEFAGALYRLRKAFGSRAEAELIGQGRQWSGDAADQQLADMLGFTPAASRGAKPQEHHGIYGLLWVEQGSAHQALGVGAGRERIAAALEQQIGDVTGGTRGRALLESAEARRLSFWDKRDNPRGEIKELARQLGDVEAARAEVQSRLADLDGKVDRLVGIEARLERHAEDGSLDEARAELAKAEAASARVAGLENEARTHADARERARLQWEAADGRLKQRLALQEQVQAGAATLLALQGEVSDAASQVARLEGAAATAAEAAREAAEAERRAGEAVRRLEAARAARRLRDMLARLESQATAAEEAERSRLAALAIVEGTKVTASDLARFEAIEDERARQKAKLEDASVRLALLPDGDTTVEIDGAIHPAGEITLAHDSTLVIPGYGRILVHPGGGVADLAETLAATEKRLDAALAKFELPDIAAARAAVVRREVAASEATQAVRVIASFAPDGLDRLRASLATLRAEVAASPEPEVAGDGDEIEKVRQAHADAARRSTQLKDGADAARANLQAASTTSTVAATRLASAQALQARETEALAQARAAEPDAAFAEAARSAQAQLQAATQLEADSRTALAGADPEATRLGLNRARQAVAAIADDIRDLTEAKRDLEVELRTLGIEGLGEKLADLEGQTERLRGQLAAQRLEADAAMLLHETLANAQRETKERWLAPVRERVAPYLQLLATDASISLDEDTLELDQVIRDGVPEPFQGLSLGAREQIAVITRLALADILRQAGHASCVVLDDALVNTDEARLQRMHLVLHRAAEHQQILILSCRERDYLKLGAPLKRM